ncbi:MAG: DUF1735 domain-containing protein [Candidatus Cryptobacteroides sp.]
MKKIIYYTALFLGLLTIAASCEDHRRDGLMPSKVYLVRNGVEQYSATADQTSAIASAWATKSGLLPSSCVVTYVIDPQDLAQYNEAYGTNYEMLPESCYTLGQMNFNLEPEDLNAEFEVTYNPSAIYALTGEYNVPGKYALPARIEVDGLEVLEGKTLVIMTFNISEPVKEPEPEE